MGCLRLTSSARCLVFVFGVLGASEEAPLLRCPDEGGRWAALYGLLAAGLRELQGGRVAGSRQLLAAAVDDATRDLHAAFRCPVGVAAAYRLLAISHLYDPAAQASPGWVAALGITLRFQQLAAGWLIYAYNKPAAHDTGFIDGSAWPITSQEFDEEHRSVATLLREQGALTEKARASVPRTERLRDLKLVIVSICAYPADNPLPRLSNSVHRLYTSRHGYDYLGHSETLSGDRPPAWGKVRAMHDALEDGRWDWALWVDCDLFFMDLGTTIDSLMLRYGSKSNSELAQEGSFSLSDLDPGFHMLLSEDSQMLNTAFFLMRRSGWSLDLLRRVWGPEDSPFVDHTWWEQAAFAQELLGGNHRRFAGVEYGPEGLFGLAAGSASHPYPREVRLVPQYEVNSYHPISSRLVGETWAPGKFVLSFNGAQSLSGPTVARLLHANYYEIFCRLNSVEEMCETLSDDRFAPWLA